MSVFPIYDTMLDRKDKEQLLGQKGKVVWFTGLSGAGKSTLAVGLEKQLNTEGRYAVVLDGDNIRTGICKDLGFTEEDRTENIRRIAEIAKLFKENGAIVLCSFVSPTRAIRSLAKSIIGSADFIEVHVATAIEVCENRDVKGLYAKARSGQIKNFTGIDAPFEAPKEADVIINTDGETIENSVQTLKEFLKTRIKL